MATNRPSGPGPAFAPYEGLPLPQPTWDNYEFWDYCKRHELRIQRCKVCMDYRFYPRPICPQCKSREVEWKKMTGKGAVYTYTINYPPVLPYFSDLVPMPVALVELDVGNVFMVGRLIDGDPKDLFIGMPVEVVWEDVSDKISLPYWTRLR